MMPHEPIRDIMLRTIRNLEFVEENAMPKGPFEVTQLINSFLGALAHPWESLRDDLNKMKLSDAGLKGWPNVAKERASDCDPNSVGDLIRFVRNAMAHGNIEFLPGQIGEIHALRIWSINIGTGQRAWGAIINIADMRTFLKCFVALANELDVKQSQAKPRIA